MVNKKFSLKSSTVNVLKKRQEISVDDKRRNNDNKKKKIKNGWHCLSKVSDPTVIENVWRCVFAISMSVVVYLIFEREPVKLIIFYSVQITNKMGCSRCRESVKACQVYLKHKVTF